MYSTSAVLATLLLGAAFVRADPAPNTPAPGAVYDEGAQCTVAWGADTTGVWTVMNIELMTGDNEAMQFLEVVATVDGTDTQQTSFSYTCPDVSVNSQVYFYQFTSPFSKNVYWTGRFTIASSDGASTAPTETEVSNGQTIDWGSGSIVGETAGAAPAYGESTAGASSTASASASASRSVSDTASASTSTSSESSTSTSASSSASLADTISSSLVDSLSSALSGALNLPSSTSDSGGSTSPVESATTNSGLGSASTKSIVKTSSKLKTTTVTDTSSATTDSPTSTNGAGALKTDGLALRAGAALFVAALTFTIAL